MFPPPSHAVQSNASPPPGGDGEDQAALGRLRNFSFAQAERLIELPKSRAAEIDRAVAYDLRVFLT
jgi:hypothetical protein